MTDLDRLLRDSLMSVGDAYSGPDLALARERFLRRRRRRLLGFAGGATAAAAAATAAIVMLTGDVTTRVHEPPIPPAGGDLTVTATIRVGDAPSGVGVGAGAVWVANSGEAAVSRVDPLGHDVATVDLPVEPGASGPDDVAAGNDTVWVATGGGTIRTIDAVSGGLGGAASIAGFSGHVDMASAGESVWVTSQGYAGLTRVDASGEPVRAIEDLSGPPTDVAFGDGYVWVLLEDGTLVRQHPRTGERVDVAALGPVEHSDLVVGGGHVWAARDGVVVRVDPATGETDEVAVDGPYVGLAAGDGSMWALSYGDGSGGSLVRIDPVTAEAAGAPLLFDGRPVDVAVGEGAVWVTDETADALLRVEVVDGGVAPTPVATDPAPAFADDLAFVYAADGDVYAETLDGDTIALVTTRQDESTPTLSPAGDAVVFERGYSLVHLELATGKEQVLVAENATAPAWGPDGRLAYAVVDYVDGPRIVVGRPFSEPEAEFAAVPGSDGAIDVTDIAWDASGDWLYYRAGWEEYFGLYEADPDGDTTPFDLTAAIGRPGAQHHAPAAVAAGGIYVLESCCQESLPDDVETVELGRIRATEGGPEYSTALELDPRQLPPSSALMHPVVVPTKLTLEVADGGRRWRTTDELGWFVGNDTDLWLLRPGGVAVYVSDVIGHAEGFTTWGGLDATR